MGSTLVRFKISEYHRWTDLTDGLHMIFPAHRWLIQWILYVIASNDPSSKCKTTRLGSTWSRKLCWIFLAPHSTADPTFHLLTYFHFITTHSRRISEVTSRVSINFENHKVFAAWNLSPKEQERLKKFNRKSTKTCQMMYIFMNFHEIPLEKCGKNGSHFATPHFHAFENDKSVLQKTCIFGTLDPTSRGKGPTHPMI